MCLSARDCIVRTLNTLTCVEADVFLDYLIPFELRFKLSNHWGMDPVVVKSVEVKDL